MFYALVKKGKSMSDNLIKFVALAPCTYTNPLTTIPADYNDGWLNLYDYGIYAIAGPNWSNNQ